MRRCALSALVLGALALTACSRHEMLIVADQYWQASVLDRSGFKVGMARLAGTQRVTARTVLVRYASSDSAKLVGAIGDNEGSPVVLSPLYSSNAETLAAQFPDRRIVAFGSGIPSKVRLANVTYLTTDPTSIYKTAAGRVASWLAAKRPDGVVQTVAGVFSDDSEGQAALAGFRQGLEAAAVSPQFISIQVSGGADRSRLRGFIDDSVGRNAAIYVLAAPSLNADAVEMLKNNTAPIVTENWDFGATYSDKVLFSVDKDIPSALMKVVETMGRPSDNEIRIPWSIVTGDGS